MAITIKHSTTTDTPVSLAKGELAYSETSDNLFIGLDGGTIAVIGGEGDHAALVNKADKSSNLSDLADTGAARTNLGLADMATQSAAAVNVTGGTIDSVTLTNITLDGGTF